MPTRKFLKQLNLRKGTPVVKKIMCEKEMLLKTNNGLCLVGYYDPGEPEYVFDTFDDETHVMWEEVVEWIPISEIFGE